MAAGLGFKTFNTGDILSASDTNGYLMQGVLVFANATARDAAITSPQEGQFAYLKDTNVTTYYTGSAWANLDTTGMTNPMTTTGDTIYSSSGSTPARLGIGTANQQLRVNAGATAPEWFTPTAAGAAITKITSNTFSSQANVDVDNCFTSTYKFYMLILNVSNSVSQEDLLLQYRYAGPSTQTTDYYGAYTWYGRGVGLVDYSFTNASGNLIDPRMDTGTGSPVTMYVTRVGNASEKPLNYATGMSQGGSQAFLGFTGNVDTARTYTGFRLLSTSGNISGTYAVYGLEN